MAQNSIDGRPAGLENGQVLQNYLNAGRGVDSEHEESKEEPAGSHTIVTTQDIVSRVLEFLSAASNETLGACVVGIGAATYFLLGRIGLVLIGLVGGIVLHATWEDNAQNLAADQSKAIEVRKRREAGLEVVKRVLDWRETKQESDGPSNDDADGIDFMKPAQKHLDFTGFQPATKAALNGLTDAVIRDYVKWWYGPVLPSDVSFPFACQQTLIDFLLAVSSHLSRKRPADTFLNFLTNSSSIVIVFLNELSAALMAPGSTSLETTEALHQYLEADPSSNLAHVLSKEQQQKKLRDVAEDILQTFLDSKAYNCQPVKVFLREILAGVVLEMTVQSCSKPHWINEWIVYLLEEGEPELMNAIDAGVSRAANGELVKSAAQSTLSERPPADPETVNPSVISTKTLPEHERTLSRAEEAMDEAMLEAKRLSELIAAEDAKKNQGHNNSELPAVSTIDSESPKPSHNGLAIAVTGSNGTLNGEEEAPQPYLTENSGRTSSFTNFDQILSSRQPTALRLDGDQSRLSAAVTSTLYNANISIFDDSTPGEKSVIRSKPTVDYLIQIEPASSQHPGWMIARKYADFETLHEVLRRISVVSGVAAFSEKYRSIPGWKTQTKAILRSDLQHYLRDALSFSRLAESEGMKRFLEKDQGLGRSSPSANKPGFGFPSPAAFENMGKGMIDVLASAPKGAAGGGKALLGGVSGVLGGVGSIGQRKQASLAPVGGGMRSARASSLSLSRTDSGTSTALGPREGQESQESLEIPSGISKELVEPLPGQLSTSSSIQQVSDLATSASLFSDTRAERGAVPLEGERTDPKIDGLGIQSIPTQPDLRLPPPPSEITDDYNFLKDSPSMPTSLNDRPTPRSSTSTAPTSFQSPPRENTPSLKSNEAPKALPPQPKPEAPVPPKHSIYPSLTEEETQIAIELFFAVVNELYNLSSAWNIRRTLLSAAKSFLLRPGTPSLESIRLLLQQTILDANTSDAALATHLNKLRENALPTEEELKTWPAPSGEEEKAALRRKARKLLVEKGMPQALTSVMGQAASGEALGRVFDCLQVEEVARGLMFALVLQGVRAVAM